MQSLMHSRTHPNYMIMKHSILRIITYIFLNSKRMFSDPARSRDRLLWSIIRHRVLLLHVSDQRIFQHAFSTKGTGYLNCKEKLHFQKGQTFIRSSFRCLVKVIDDDNKKMRCFLKLKNYA